MSTTELRSSLHRVIEQIDDEAVLKAHLTLLTREIKQPTGDFWDELSPEQQASIDRGLTDLAAGRRKTFAEIVAKLTQ